MVQIKTKELKQLTTLNPDKQKLQFVKYNFYQTTFEWAHRPSYQVADSPWVLLDVIGPLEVQRSGMFNLLNHLYGSNIRFLVL